MNEEQITIDWHSLWQFTKAVFMAVGLSPGDAATEADVLVWANLRGVDSHGVQRIPMYVRMVEGGLIKPDAQIRVVKERPAGLLVEADHAFGPVVTVFTMERLIQKARDVGAAFAFIRNTTHQGAMGYYPLLAARRGMAGLAWVCNPPNMAPYGAKAAGVHNSPLAIAVPGAEREAVILDMATSIAAAGKVDVARDKGIPIPADWALDADGSPTTDPNQAKIMRPFGRYKGYGLAFMLAGLSSLMVGNPLIVPRLRDTDDQPPLGTQNSALAVIDIESWTDLGDYQENLDELVEAIKDLPKAQGVEEIFVPGEPEDRVREVREATGIPLPTGTAERLQEVADQLEIPVPWTLR